MKTAIALATLLLAAAGASAQQQVWRCGNTYSQQPCEGATKVDTADPRSAAQAAESRANTQRDAKTASAMEKDRLAMEAKAAPAQVFAPPPAAPAASAPKADEAKSRHAKKQAKKPKNFTAQAPAAAPVTLRVPVKKAAKGQPLKKA